MPVDALYRMTRMGSKGTDPLEPANLLVSTIPTPIVDVLQRAMAISSNDRFETVEEFWLALNVLLAEKSVSVPVTDEVSSSEEPGVLDASLSALPAVIDATPPVIVERLTPLALGSPDASLHREARIRPLLRGRSYVLFFTVLALVALFMGVVFGEDIWPHVTHSGHLGSSVTSTMTIPSRSVPTTAAVSPSPVASPLPTVSPSSPTVSASYPVLVQRYEGHIVDRYTTPPTEAGMSLLQIRQNQTTIYGYFLVGPGLTGSGNFAGTVSAENKIQFLVSSQGGRLPLFFEGYVQPGGSISGRYCSYQNNHCNYAGGGYGIWYVSQSAGWVGPERGDSPTIFGFDTFHALSGKASPFSSSCETSL